MYINDYMNQILGRFNQLAAENASIKDPHLFLCSRLADEFELWIDKKGSSYDQVFPTWLSRVVDGWLQDKADGIDITL